jgi:transcriptional regulator with GAF, ATPase, and Fis domain
MPPEGPWFQSTHPNAPASGYTGPDLALSVVHPPEVAGGTFTLRPGLVFGRAPEAHSACIAHPTISRSHARIQSAMGGVLCLLDEGSRNGSRVDGKAPEAPVPLVPQTLIRLGDVHAVVDLPSSRRFDEDPVLPGTSTHLARVREQLERTAAEVAPVLIVGETGTGKERVARDVHRLSGRRGQYVTLNCAELSAQLIESQLFGYERGAFPGATATRAGLFKAAHGGTLFLDEIGELPLDLQPKLLRVLQEGEVRRLGSVDVERVDVRVVCATNRDLPQCVEAGSFRRDLYARLSFYELRLPALRERKQDILAWVALLSTLRARDGRPQAPPFFTPDAVERILLHTWPDNLRGIDRMVHRLATLDPGEPIGVRALVDCMPELEAPKSTAPAARMDAATPVLKAGASSRARANEGRPSDEELLAFYEASGRSVRAAAKHFGKDRRQIYRWLESLGITRDGESD